MGCFLVEKAITDKIIAFLKSVPLCFAWKEHGGMYGTAGLPDVICCHRGRFVAFEVKTPAGKLTKLQSYMIQKINAAGGSAYKVSSVDEVRFILETLEDTPNVNSVEIS
jgi:Holliday junction resolvase